MAFLFGKKTSDIRFGISEQGTLVALVVVFRLYYIRYSWAMLYWGRSPNRRTNLKSFLSTSKP